MEENIRISPPEVRRDIEETVRVLPRLCPVVVVVVVWKLTYAWLGVQEKRFIELSLEDDLANIEATYMSHSDSPRGHFWVLVEEIDGMWLFSCCRCNSS
jgi:hypothetical protein